MPNKAHSLGGAERGCLQSGHHRRAARITLRNYSPRTAEAYVHAVYCLAQHYHRSPDALSDPQVREYLLHLHLNTGKSASTLNVAASGLRFFFRHVLRRNFYHLEKNLPRPRQPKRKPKAYSLREVRKLIHACTHPKHRAFLVTVYGAGLRLNEGCHLRPEHIERDQRLIRVEQGKGRKDRYTILPESVLLHGCELLIVHAVPMGLGMFLWVVLL